MRSINYKHSLKILKDLYVQYMIWMFWALAVLLTGVLISLPFSEFFRTMQHSALAAITRPAEVFLFIVGIITGVYIIQYYIRQGVTRRSFFVGTVAAALATAVSIQLIGVGLHITALLLEAITPFQAGRALTGYLGQVHSFPVTIGISTLILSLQFLLGWAIGFAFYRFRTIGGFICILYTLLTMTAINSIWTEGGIVTINGANLIPAINLPLGVAVSLTLGIVALQLTVLYRMIRNAPVKV